MLVPKIKGLKYPDEYFTKFFFKNKLDQKINLKFLEFGCGHGNNLMLPYQYENEVIGIDYSSDLVEMANYNFKLFENDTKFTFHSEDMRTFSSVHKNIKADVFILPSVIYYISKQDFIQFLHDIVDSNNIKEGIPFYIRVRTPKDFRYGYGIQIDSTRFKMPDVSITGEHSAEIEFYNEFEIVDVLRECLNLRDYRVFCLENQNEQCGHNLLNSDVAIWGTIG